MERTFFPTRSYWGFFGSTLVVFWIYLIGFFVAFSLTEDNPFPAWSLITALAVCLSAVSIYGVLVYRRKRLVISEDEIRSYGALHVRAMRFIDVVEADWIIHATRPYCVQLRSPKTKLEIYLDQPFVQRGEQEELLDLLHSRLRPGVRQDWERFQALREGRASSWSPPLFTLKRISSILAITTGLAVASGAAVSFLLRIKSPNAAEWWAGAVARGEISTVIKIPGVVKWPWSGSLLLDWSLVVGFMGLYMGISFLLFLRILEWTHSKWRTIEGRRLERELTLPAPGSFQRPSDSRSE